MSILRKCAYSEMKLVILPFSLMKLSIYRHFFDMGFMAHQDYFTYFEQSQSIGGAKTGDPREKPPDRPQAGLGLSHK